MGKGTGHVSRAVVRDSFPNCKIQRPLLPGEVLHSDHSSCPDATIQLDCSDSGFALGILEVRQIEMSSSLLLGCELCNTAPSPQSTCREWCQAVET